MLAGILLSMRTRDSRHFAPFGFIAQALGLASLLITACAQSAGWSGGDSCSQIRKNREEIGRIENQIAALGDKNQGGEDEVRDRQIRDLEEKKQDLQFSSESLKSSCTVMPNAPRNESADHKFERELNR